MPALMPSFGCMSTSTTVASRTCFQINRRSFCGSLVDMGLGRVLFSGWWFEAPAEDVFGVMMFVLYLGVRHSIMTLLKHVSVQVRRGHWH